MKLKSFGCSLVYGTDLPDVEAPGDPASDLTWPALVAKKQGLSYRCQAEGGCGNLSIMSRVLESLQLTSDVVYVIQWTFIDRFDYSDPQGRHFDLGTKDWLTLRPNENSEISQYYYRNLHSEFHDKLRNLVYINTAIECLQKSGTPFVMTCLDDLLLDTRWHTSPALLDLQARVRPHLQYFDNENFLAWSRTKGFAMSSTGHPLQEAHAAACDLMLPVISSILHRA